MRNNLYDLSETDKLIVQAHYYEYQSSQNRITRFFTLQFSVWPILIAFLTFLFGIADKHPSGNFIPILIWLGIFATLFTTQFYYFSLHEVYNHVGYIENFLRPKVSTYLRRNSFWGWERHLKKFGKANPPVMGDWGPIFIPIFALGFGLKLESNVFEYINYICIPGFLASLYFLPYSTAKKVDKLRKEFDLSKLESNYPR
jgi:hypothetical protein